MATTRLRTDLIPPPRLKDEPWAKRHLITLSLLVISATGGFIAVMTYSGAYFDVLQAVPAVKHTYDAALPIPWLRHLDARDAMEKVFAGATFQVLIYYFAKKWPPRLRITRWDRLEGRLGIVNPHLGHQGVVPLLLAPLWLIVYSQPGVLAFAAVLWLTGHSLLEPAAWQISIAGLLGSAVMGRRIAKGFAYHLQRLINRERLENGHTKPAWWMTWPMRRHFDYDRDAGMGRLEHHEHPAARRTLHIMGWALAILVVIGWTFQGYVVRKYFGFDFSHPLAHVHFHLPDLWQGWL